MLRTPSPWPVRSVTGTPSRNCTSGRQLLVICKNSFFVPDGLDKSPLPCFAAAHGGVQGIFQRVGEQHAKVALRDRQRLRDARLHRELYPGLGGAVRKGGKDQIRHIFFANLQAFYIPGGCTAHPFGRVFNGSAVPLCRTSKNRAEACILPAERVQ